MAMRQSWPSAASERSSLPSLLSSSASFEIAVDLNRDRVPSPRGDLERQHNSCQSQAWFRAALECALRWPPGMEQGHHAQRPENGQARLAEQPASQPWQPCRSWGS